MPEAPLKSWDGNIVLSSVSVISLLTHIDTGLIWNNLFFLVFIPGINRTPGVKCLTTKIGKSVDLSLDRPLYLWFRSHPSGLTRVYPLRSSEDPGSRVLYFSYFRLIVSQQLKRSSTVFWIEGRFYEPLESCSKTRGLESVGRRNIYSSKDSGTSLLLIDWVWLPTGSVGLFHC